MAIRLGEFFSPHLNTPHVCNWLVVDLPLWKMMEFVSWDYYSIYGGTLKKCSKPPTRLANFLITRTTIHSTLKYPMFRPLSATYYGYIWLRSHPVKSSNMASWEIHQKRWCPPSFKLVYSPMKTVDISPTKTIVTLELCSPTERYRGRGHHLV